MDELDQNPQAQKLLRDQAALRQVLSSPDAQKVLAQLQKADTSRLQAAAQAALKGDASQLNGILQALSQNPEAAKAIQSLTQKFSK
ncbi:MAG: hypothetical protein Q4C76_01685 [Bacillota bacterium]|nr:hypothetical protein [Bacillota bacterium]